MRTSGGDIRVTQAPKNMEMIICGRRVVENLMWRELVQDFGRKKVDEVRSNMQGLNPEGGREIDEQGIRESESC